MTPCRAWCTVENQIKKSEVGVGITRKGGVDVEALWYVGSRRGGHRVFVKEGDRLASCLSVI